MRHGRKTRRGRVNTLHAPRSRSARIKRCAQTKSGREQESREIGIGFGRKLKNPTAVNEIANFKLSYLRASLNRKKLTLK